MSEERVTCPACKGERKTFMLVDGRAPDGSHVGWSQIGGCYTCTGLGTIPKDYADRIAEGNRRRQIRIAQHRSLREEAERLGIAPQDLNHMEWGRMRFPDQATKEVENACEEWRN